MTDFETFKIELLELIEKFQDKGIPIKFESDPNSDIIKIYGEKSSSLDLAKYGLNAISELTITTAEHHPYWKILDASQEIISTILEKWTGKLNSNDIEELEWFLKQIGMSLDNIKNQSSQR
jgi:hypothetical protein